jgi:hypothetical protein
LGYEYEDEDVQDPEPAREEPPLKIFLGKKFILGILWYLKAGAVIYSLSAVRFWQGDKF